MKTRYILVAIALAGGVSAFAAPPVAPVATPVVVNFQDPEKFRDVREDEAASERVRDSYLSMFKEHLEMGAPRYLAEGQTLTITFTDIDMAGDFEPWRGLRFDEIRIVKDIYPPRLKFSFKVTDAAGAVVKEGERKLVDHAFLMQASLGSRMDSLYYEKAMLDDWLRKEFGAPKKTAKSR